ncbi:hypothetical protein N183_21615 [Sinorhizobium sp. Sb3]|nr:hypothetical protein N183_21615 [Sinorhizobium sp. Sb3]
MISRVGRLFFYESSAFHEAAHSAARRRRRAKVRCGTGKRREGEAGRSGPDIGTSSILSEAMWGLVTP